MPVHGAHGNIGSHRADGLVLADNVGTRLLVDDFRERCHQLPNVDDDLQELGVDEVLEDGCGLLLHRILRGHNGERLRQPSPFPAEIIPLHQAFLPGRDGS